MILLAAIAAAVVVPVGFALSLESSSGTPSQAATPSTGRGIVAMTSSSAPLWLPAGESSWPLEALDGPGLFVIGGALFALAMVLKKNVPL